MSPRDFVLFGIFVVFCGCKDNHSLPESVQLQSYSSKKKVKTWLPEDSEGNASYEDGGDTKDDTTRDGKKNPSLQNYRWKNRMKERPFRIV